ncbi:MAG: preprotein translocase subunit SecG [Puniceicoccales bacterium]|jgi:preprotein translocase subunit SecG|nr:preprotein translocase subunit SecG [Puniceicoccales bacterium]
MIYVAYFFALVLALVSLFAVLVILMQRPSSNAGMGAALGGGAAESAFGGDAANVLSKLTYSLITLFFIISFGLYLVFLANGNSQKKAPGNLDILTTPPPAAAQPAQPAPVPPAPTQGTTPAQTPTPPDATPTQPVPPAPTPPPPPVPAPAQ